MNESELAWMFTVDQQTGRSRSIDLGQRFERADVEYVRQPDDLETATHHRCRRQHGLCGLTESGDPLHDPLPNADREVATFECVPRHVPKMAEQLDPEEWAATGQRVQLCHRFDAQRETGCLGHIGDVGRPERTELDHRCVGAHGEFVIDVTVDARPASDDDGQRSCHVVEQLAQQRHRRAIDPLHVVDHQGDRSPEGGQRISDPAEEAATVDPTLLIALELSGFEWEQIVAEGIEERFERPT